jgi:hypothetical protein
MLYDYDDYLRTRASSVLIKGIEVEVYLKTNSTFDGVTLNIRNSGISGSTSDYLVSFIIFITFVASSAHRPWIKLINDWHHKSSRHLPSIWFHHQMLLETLDL